MTEDGLRRFTAYSGFLCTALYVGLIPLLGDAPTVQATAEEVLRWATANRSMILASIFIWGASVAALFCFATGLWALLKKTEGENAVLSTLGLGAAFTTFIISVSGFLFLLALAYKAPDLDAATAKTLSDLTLLSVALTGIPTALTLAPWLVVMRKSSLFPPVLRWLGYGVVVLHVVSSAAFARSGMLSPSGLGVWVAPPMYYLWVTMTGVFCLVAKRVPA